MQEEVVSMALKFSFTFWSVVSNLDHFTLQSGNVNLINIFCGLNIE